MARSIFIIAATLALCASSGLAQLLPSRAPAPSQPGAGKSVYDVVAALPDTTIFARLIRVARSNPTVAALTDPAFVGTVFVPTDKAFNSDERKVRSNLGVASFNDLFTTPAAAARLIAEHIITGQALQVAQLPTSSARLRNALGDTLGFTTGYLYGRYVQGPSGNAKLTSAGGDIPAGNAYVHRIDSVLVPKKQ